jgi:predicted nucleic acid-binding protein
VFELLLNTKKGKLVTEQIRPSSITLHAPHLLDLEILQVMRRYVHKKKIPNDRAAAAVFDLRQLDIARYSHEPFIPRIWALRHNLTSYDAAYVTLAETIDAPLLTLDARLAASTGHQAKIICPS